MDPTTAAASAPPPWRTQAACATQTARMYPDPRDTPAVAAAKAVCAGCPVREACLADAVERRERYGVWGGVDELARYRMRLAQTSIRRVCRWCGQPLDVTLRTGPDGRVQVGGDERNRAFHPPCYEVFDRQRRAAYKRDQRAVLG